MSERGVFAVDRGVWDHPVLMEQDAPYSRVQAWIWLLSEASWKPRAYKAGDAVVSLKRGEIAHSIRYMGAAWSWKPAKVQRFLKCLKANTMIDTRVDTGVTVVTILKYDEYQRVSLPRDTPADTPTDTVAIQPRYRKEDIENIEDKKKEVVGADAPNVLEFTGGKYEFEGETIKAAPATMKRFRSEFPNLTDLPAALRVVDAYYTHEKPLADPTKWFFPVYRWLEKENREAYAKRREATRGVDWW